MVFARLRVRRLVVVELEVQRGRTQRVAGPLQILTALGQAEAVLFAAPALFVRRKKESNRLERWLPSVLMSFGD